MWWWGQLSKSNEQGNAPDGLGLLMDRTWHVPNDEVVVITVCYPKTRSENHTLYDAN